MPITATRYHDISCGHRVHGHENKCASLHGHSYRVHFTLEADALDNVGRVLDFSVINSILCAWLENNWDHKFLAWDQDTVMQSIAAVGGTARESIVWLPFNPTAEEMAVWLLHHVGPTLLPVNVQLVRVVVDETRKCSAAASL